MFQRHYSGTWSWGHPGGAGIERRGAAGTGAVQARGKTYFLKPLLATRKARYAHHRKSAIK